MSELRTRRARLARILAVLFTVALVAAACGDDDGDAEGTTTTSGPDATTDTTTGDGTTTTTAGDGAEVPEDLDPDGVIRIPSGLLADGSPGANLDLATITTPAGSAQYLIYDTLLREQPDGSFEPGLALAAEAVDASTITVELRPDVQFSDGSDLTADVARFSILRNRDEGEGGAFADELRQIDDIEVVDDLNFTIHFADPVAGTFYSMLGRGETMIVSQEAIESGRDPATDPVGAGPYLFDSLEFESTMTLVKNPDYFDADSIRVPTVEYHHVNQQADPQSIVNALLGDIVDVGTALSPDQVEAVQGGSDLEVTVEVSPSVLLWGQMCKGGPKLQVPALADVQVRQALNFAVDRDRVNEVVYGGASEPQWGFWPEDHPFHDPELTGFFEYDPDRARELLTEAGYPDGFAFEAFISPGGPGALMSEIVQQNWADIGVDMTFETLTNVVPDFFGDNLLPLYFFPLGRSGLDKVTRNLTGESIGNICEWDDPELNAVIEELKGLPQDANNPDTVDAWYRLDRIALEGAMNIFGVFGTQATAVDTDRVGDVDWRPNFQGAPILDVMDVYVKQ